MAKFNELYDFIDRAIKSRKYPENTGMSLKAALKLFDKELNDEEHASVDEFRKNINQIYQNVFTKSKDFTAASLATYKSRVIKVLNDYERYGVDPTKMANWSPKIVVHSKKQAPFTEEKRQSTREDSVGNMDSCHSFDFAGGVKLLIPKTKKFTEAIMDGGLKDIKTKLNEFSEANSDMNHLESNGE